MGAILPRLVPGIGGVAIRVIADCDECVNQTQTDVIHGVASFRLMGDIGVRATVSRGVSMKGNQHG